MGVAASSYMHLHRNGSAANLEIALALARNNLRPKNKVIKNELLFYVIIHVILCRLCLPFGELRN